MQPRIKDQLAWQQTELLMQPALIRVLDNIRKKLEDSPWTGTYESIQTPYPGYRLDLKCSTQRISIDIWQLCYQVCFRDYSRVDGSTEAQDVEIDTQLIDERGEIAWNVLEEKTQTIIHQLFVNLPATPPPPTHLPTGFPTGNPTSEGLPAED